MATAKTKPAAAEAAPAQKAAPATPEDKKPKPRLLQEDVPSYSLDQALRVARSIADNYAYRPTKPINVAGAMGMTHTSGPFRAISGASVAYGITTGAAQGAEIGITPLGMRIVQPVIEGDDMAARREALLRPKIIGEFLRTYDGAALPSDLIARNVLVQKGVPVDRAEGVLQLIIDGASEVGFIREWGNGKLSVDLAGPMPTGDGDRTLTREAAPAAIPAAARPTPAQAASAAVSVGAGVHVNIEIHIAADASSETIEDIFRNMRRYVLTDGQTGDGQTDAE